MITPTKAEQWQVVEIGAGVRRYHTKQAVFPQNVGEHSFRMVMLLIIMFKVPSRALLMAAAVHDLAEGKFGDVPAPTKRAIPALKTALDVAEQAYLGDHGFDFRSLLTEDDKRVLKLVDNLDGYLYSDREVNMGNLAFVPTRLNFGRYILGMPLPAEEWRAVADVLGEGHVGPLAWEHLAAKINEVNNQGAAE